MGSTSIVSLKDWSKKQRIKPTIQCPNEAYSLAYLISTVQNAERDSFLSQVKFQSLEVYLACIRLVGIAISPSNPNQDFISEPCLSAMGSIPCFLLLLGSHLRLYIPTIPCSCYLDCLWVSCCSAYPSAFVWADPFGLRYLFDLIPIKPLNKTPKSKEAAKEAKRRSPYVAFFVLPEVGFEKKSSNGPRTSGEECKKMGGRRRAIK